MDIGLSDPSLIPLRDATCYWFNVLPPVGEAAGSTVSTITIQKRYCPFRYGVFDAIPCPDSRPTAPPAQRRRFTLNDDPATQQSADANGQSFSTRSRSATLPSAKNNRRRSTRRGSSASRIRYTDEVVTFDLPRSPLHRRRVATAFWSTSKCTPGNKIDCLWFNGWITEEDLGSLIITKFVCPRAGRRAPTHSGRTHPQLSGTAGRSLLRACSAAAESPGERPTGMAFAHSSTIRRVHTTCAKPRRPDMRRHASFATNTPQASR